MKVHGSDLWLSRSCTETSCKVDFLLGYLSTQALNRAFSAEPKNRYHTPTFLVFKGQWAAIKPGNGWLQPWRGRCLTFPRLFPLQLLLLPLLLHPMSLALPQRLWLTSPLSRQRDQYQTLIPEESRIMELEWTVLCDDLPLKHCGGHWQILSLREKFPV